MPRERVYMRLVEKIERRDSNEERLKAVRVAVEKLGPIEWEVGHPRFHPRGGFDIAFHSNETPNFDGWLEMLDNDGYRGVI